MGYGKKEFGWGTVIEFGKTVKKCEILEIAEDVERKTNCTI